MAKMLGQPTHEANQWVASGSRLVGILISGSLLASTTTTTEYRALSIGMTASVLESCIGLACKRLAVPHFYFVPL